MRLLFVPLMLRLLQTFFCLHQLVCRVAGTLIGQAILDLCLVQFADECLKMYTQRL